VNKIKEKKLNSIKSQIVEITDFAESVFEDKTQKTFINKKNDIENKEKDTFILTKIIEPLPKSTSQLDNINFIKDELSIVKSMLSKQEKTLESILLKIK
jgi:hypothetical protein